MAPLRFCECINLLLNSVCVRHWIAVIRGRVLLNASSLGFFVFYLTLSLDCLVFQRLPRVSTILRLYIDTCVYVDI